MMAAKPIRTASRIAGCISNIVRNNKRMDALENIRPGVTVRA